MHNGFGLLLFHASYWGSFGHLTFLLVFLAPSCFLLVCLMATVPQGCFCPGAGHAQPWCLRVVPALVLVTHSHSPTGMSLPSVGHPWAAVCPLFDTEVLPPRVHLQPHISTAVFPSICLPKSVPCASPVCNGCWSS